MHAGGYDSEVKVWDTNSLQVVCSFSLAARVHAAAMSACATSHCLVAVGSGDTQVGCLLLRPAPYGMPLFCPACRGLAAWAPQQ